MKRHRQTRSHNVGDLTKSTWRADALCVDAEPSDFDDKVTIEQYRQTVAMFCDDCPVRRECFDEGKRIGGWGIWGGAYLLNGTPNTVPTQMMPETIPHRQSRRTA